MILSELVRDETTESVLTMKWFNRTAQGFQPWVRLRRRSALPVRQSFALSSEGGKVAPEVRRGWWNQRGNIVNARFGRHFQGGLRASSNPGLKPWAILSDHFMVQNFRRKKTLATLPIPKQIR